jgi:hypothetical protein
VFKGELSAFLAQAKNLSPMIQDFEHFEESKGPLDSTHSRI